MKGSLFIKSSVAELEPFSLVKPEPKFESSFGSIQSKKKVLNTDKKKNKRLQKVVSESRKVMLDKF